MVELRKRKLPSDFHEVEVGIKRSKISEQINVSRERKSPSPKRLKSSGQEITLYSSDVGQKLSSSQVVKYNTRGDGNCFFHAVFGDNSSGRYEAERAQDMRMEWHKFLSQFKSLDDASMPAPLRDQLEKVFNMFLDKPGDLTGKSDKIKELVDQTKRKIENAEDNVKTLVSKAVSKLNISHDQAMSDLGEYAEALGENEYNAQYNSEFITRSFLNSSELYQAYLEAIKSQGYFVFIEEVQILASLANIEINVHYKDNNSEEQQKFEPNPEMINNDDQLNQVFNRENYELNNELWGSKERETIYLESGHYSRAKVITKEIQEQEDFQLAKKLQLDEILEYCNLSKDNPQRVKIEERFDELLAKNADGKICDVVGQCVSDIKQHIEQQNPSSLLSSRCGMESMTEQPFHQQPQLVKP